LDEFLGLKTDGLEKGGSTLLKNSVRCSYVQTVMVSHPTRL